MTDPDAPIFDEGAPPPPKGGAPAPGTPPGPAPAPGRSPALCVTPDPDEPPEHCPEARAARERLEEALRAAEEQRRRADDEHRRAEGLREELERVRAEARAAEERHSLDLLLIEADAVDLEAARLLAGLAINREKGADLRAAVAELRRTRPYLFRPPPARHPGAASSPAAIDTDDPARDAARLALATGDRASLMRYLRARRNA